MHDKPVVIIGGGPAGLTAAYELTQFSHEPVVLEKSGILGGLARTEQYKGFYFDIGGHRFFTKAKAVEKIWHEVLGDDFQRRPRLSRIFYDGKFFNYPLKPINALRGLGVVGGSRILLSYLKWQLFPYPQEDTFEEWVTNRFGKKLFSTFFQTYTEKVWGIPCSELKAEWAAQRIKDLSLKTALLSMFLKSQGGMTTLIEEFQYPRLGPGMMWQSVGARIEKAGGTVRTAADVIRIRRNGNVIDHVVIASDGHEEAIAGSHFISSMPLTEFIKRLEPPPPSAVLEAAHCLNYRDFLTVCLIVDQPEVFPDNWIYIHDPSVKVGRIQNFKNWSPDMVPDLTKTSLGLEYFCNEGDDFWTTPDHQLIELGKEELQRIGMARTNAVVDGCVFRAPKAYPVYDEKYREHLTRLKEFVAGLDNFQTVGRNGLHRYNNQDHSMLTGTMAAHNFMRGERNDLWNVNADQEYHEEIHGQAETAQDEIVQALEPLLNQVFMKLDRWAFGTSVGTLLGAALCLITLLLVIKGGDVVGPNLQLLSQFYPRYTVTYTGSLIGLVYGFITGFGVGWGFAVLRNAWMLLYTAHVNREAKTFVMRRLLDYL